MRVTLAVLLAGPAVVRAADTVVAADAHVTEVVVGQHLTSHCEPYAWSDYTLQVDTNLTDYNLLFEVEDITTAFNPTGLSIALWEDEVPIDRAAEHRSDRANGKIWAVGMNNNCPQRGGERTRNLLPCPRSLLSLPH